MTFCPAARHSVANYELKRHKITHLSEVEKDKLYVFFALVFPIVISIPFLISTFDRKHKCPYPGCATAMLQKNNLLVHYKSHFGVKDEVCQFCGVGVRRPIVASYGIERLSQVLPRAGRDKGEADRREESHAARGAGSVAIVYLPDGNCLVFIARFFDLLCDHPTAAASYEHHSPLRCIFAMGRLVSTTSCSIRPHDVLASQRELEYWHECTRLPGSSTVHWYVLGSLLVGRWPIEICRLFACGRPSPTATSSAMSGDQAFFAPSPFSSFDDVFITQPFWREYVGLPLFFPKFKRLPISFLWHM